MKRIIILLAAATWPVSNAATAEFEADILPIFQSKCAKCHMDGSSKGGVALDAEDITKEIGSSKAIVPGDTEKGDLLEVVSLPDDDNDRMPPPDKGRALSAAEISKIKEWIAAGAIVGDEEPAMTEEKPAAAAGLAKRPDPIDGTWTNREGKSITATLMRMDGDKAVLRMSGKEFPYDVSNLSDADQAKVREFADAWKASSGG